MQDSYLSGQVVCATTGEPIANCVVTLNYYADNAVTNPWYTTTGLGPTDANGNFSWLETKLPTTPPDLPGGNQGYWSITLGCCPNQVIESVAVHGPMGNSADTMASMDLGILQCNDCCNDVWMKDTALDTGIEPDPDPSPMWLSPSVWIRNNPDNGTSPQDPIIGVSNTVYVSVLSKGSSTATGKIRVYVAQASSGLGWPGSWMEVTPFISAAIPPTGTIVSMTWIPVWSGHVCMLVRWESDDPCDTTPPAIANDPSVDVQARQSNNIIWRNLHVIDGNGVGRVIVRNIVAVRTATTLAIRPAPGQEAFMAAGWTTVILDATLNRLWIAGGSLGRGFQMDQGVAVITDPAGAVFENIVLGPRQEGVATLHIVHSRVCPPGEHYRIDFVQYASAHVPLDTMVPVGGVSYEVHPAPLAHAAGPAVTPAKG
jgi:hypothetical protein